VTSTGTPPAPTPRASRTPTHSHRIERCTGLARRGEELPVPLTHCSGSARITPRGHRVPCACCSIALRWYTAALWQLNGIQAPGLSRFGRRQAGRSVAAAL
jgi:hypothetical protein